MTAPVRIAMWSGPRNISTAMMRSFENRHDTQVVDEPFYAYYLARTGDKHPMDDAIIAAHESDKTRVTQSLLAPLADGTSVFYQKHMPHHMVDVDLDGWIDPLTHIFLLRDPRRMLASYVQKHDIAMSPEVLGFPQMMTVYDAVLARCGAPLILHSEDVLHDPSATLKRLCDRIGIGFDPAMLSWPAGKRDSDGIWADHWYDRVIHSTGFAPFDAALPDLPPALAAVADACMPYYRALAARAAH